MNFREYLAHMFANGGQVLPLIHASNGFTDDLGNTFHNSGLDNPMPAISDYADQVTPRFDSNTAGNYLSNTPIGATASHYYNGFTAGQWGNGKLPGTVGSPSGTGGLGNPLNAINDHFQGQLPGIDQSNAGQFSSAITNGLNTNMEGNFGRVPGQIDNLNNLGSAFGGTYNSANGQLFGNLLPQLTQEASGQGVGAHLADNMFNQQAQANQAQGAALIGAQKGISPGLMGREIAQNAAMANQGAAQNAANYRLQSQLGAQQNLGNVLGGAMNVSGQGANTAYGNAGQLGLGYGQGVSGAQNAQLGHAISGQGNLNTAITQGSLGSQGLTASANAINTETAGKVIGGGLGGLGAIGAAAVSAARGGSIPSSMGTGFDVIKHANPQLAQMLMGTGGAVPGQPLTDHNSLKNDVVPSLLSPKEIVLPLSVTMAPDAPQRAAQFVEQLRAHTQPHYAKVVEARRKLAELEKKYAGGYAC